MLNKILKQANILSLCVKKQRDSPRTSEEYELLLNAPYTKDLDTCCIFMAINDDDFKKLKNRVQYAIKRLKAFKFETRVISTEAGKMLYVAKCKLNKQETIIGEENSKQ